MKFTWNEFRNFKVIFYNLPEMNSVLENYTITINCVVFIFRQDYSFRHSSQLFILVPLHQSSFLDQIKIRWLAKVIWLFHYIALFLAISSATSFFIFPQSRIWVPFACELIIDTLYTRRIVCFFVISTASSLFTMEMFLPWLTPKEKKMN